MRLSKTDTSLFLSFSQILKLISFFSPEIASRGLVIIMRKRDRQNPITINTFYVIFVIGLT